MKEDEVKVFYSGGLNAELDKAIADCLKEFGYKRWASGMEIGSQVRDLAFDRGIGNFKDAVHEDGG